MADDLTQIKDDLGKLEEAVSGKDGLLVRAAVAETRMETMDDKLDSQGGELKALRVDLSNHISSSQLQHGALKLSVDNMSNILGNLATKDDLKALNAKVVEVAECEEQEAVEAKKGFGRYISKETAASIGTVIGTIITTLLAAWGINFATAGVTAPPQPHPTEQHAAVPVSQLPQEDGPEEAP